MKTPDNQKCPFCGYSQEKDMPKQFVCGTYWARFAKEFIQSAQCMRFQIKKLKSDASLLDWLEEIAHEGYCPAVLFDDNGHWTVSFEGHQNVATGSDPCDISTSFWVDEIKWYNTLREAIMAAKEEIEKESEKYKEWVLDQYEENEE